MVGMKGKSGGSRRGAGAKPTKLVAGNQRNVNGEVATATNKGPGAISVFAMNKKRKEDAGKKAAVESAARTKQHKEEVKRRKTSA